MDTQENGFLVVTPLGETQPIFERLNYPCQFVFICGKLLKPA